MRLSLAMAHFLLLTRVSMTMGNMDCILFNVYAENTTGGILLFRIFFFWSEKCPHQEIYYHVTKAECPFDVLLGAFLELTWTDQYHILIHGEGRVEDTVATQCQHYADMSAFLNMASLYLLGGGLFSTHSLTLRGAVHLSPLSVCLSLLIHLHTCSTSPSDQLSFCAQWSSFE